MNYTQEERLDIRRRIYNNEITRYEAAEEYGISDQTARTHMRLYRAINQIPPKNRNRNAHAPTFFTVAMPADMKTFATMTKEELIEEVIKTRIVKTKIPNNPGAFREVSGQDTLPQHGPPKESVSM